MRESWPTSRMASPTASWQARSALLQEAVVRHNESYIPPKPSRDAGEYLDGSERVLVLGTSVDDQYVVYARSSKGEPGKRLAAVLERLKDGSRPFGIT